MPNIIEIHTLTMTFKNQMVLNNIDYAFEQGLIHGIIGRNGSGKSVLFKLISGLIYPTSGWVTVNHKRIGIDTEFVGIIIESPSFLNSYSGIDNLRILARINNQITDQDIKHCIELVKLDPKSNMKVGEYSLGMKQRLGIAQAIMERPNLIILDEPMNSLDEESVGIVTEILLHKKQEGATILMASHHKEDIEGLCDKVHLLSEGKIISQS